MPVFECQLHLDTEMLRGEAYQSIPVKHNKSGKGQL